MKTKPLSEILKRVKSLRVDPVDLVVGVARGGIVPAYLVASLLKVPLEFIWINFRDEHHKPQRREPKLLKHLQFDPRNKRILLVDDQANTGKTLAFTKRQLSGATSVSTLVFNGPADYTLFDEDCFKMPWNLREA